MEQMLRSFCSALLRAEELEKSVMLESGFVQGNDDMYLYSDERAAVTDFFSSINTELPIGVIHTLEKGKLIGDLITNLKNHLITNGGISEIQEQKLNRAHYIRMNVYEHMAYASL